jgi:hypothetical protein
MRTIDVKLADISRDNAYDFSFPRSLQRFAALAKKFPGLPLLIVDQAKRLVWGHGYFHFLLRRGQKSTVVLETDITPAEAFFLNFNLSNRLFKLNLYEKLLFVKKLSGLCPGAEIQRRAELDFQLNDMLLQRLDEILSVSLRPVLASGQLSLKAALRLTDISLSDRRALLGLYKQVKFSESHQLLVIQLLEETAFREKKTFARILVSLALTDLLKLEMPQQKIMDALNRRRFPVFSRHESEWRQWQKKITIPGRLTIAHVPFFANEEIQISLTAKNKQEAEEILRKLK